MTDTAVLPKDIPEKISGYFKLGALISSIIGPYFLFNFLFLNKIPVPSDAQSFLFLLPAVALLGIILSLYLAATIFLPAVAVHFFGFDMRDIFYENDDQRKLDRKVIARYAQYHGITGLWITGVNIRDFFSDVSSRVAIGVFQGSCRVSC